MTAPRFQLLDWPQLGKLPAPTWLVDEYLPAGGLAALTGATASGKTFLALDLALSVTTGLAWHGAKIGGAGPVVYVAAEGVSGVRDRAEAWLESRGAPDGPGDLQVLGDPVNLGVPSDVEAFIEAMRLLPHPPRLVVFDTLARCMVGVDENSAAGMGSAVDGAGRIQRTTGATVLLVHHTGHNHSRERGSSALRAAMDTAMTVKKTGARVALSCTKQKEAEEFATETFRLERVRSSLVLNDLDGGTRDLRAAIEATVEAAAEPMSRRELEKAVGGNSGRRRAAIAAALDDPTCPVARDENDRIIYAPSR